MNATRRISTIAAALALMAGAAAPVALGDGEHTQRVCFPAESWDRADRNRPCARVMYSVLGFPRLRVADADGDRRYSVRGYDHHQARVARVLEDGSVVLKRRNGDRFTFGARDR